MIRPHTIGIERDVRGELGAGLVPHCVEAFQAREERRLAAAGEAHEDHALPVDARVLGEEVERTIDIKDEVQSPEERLVRGSPAPGRVQ